MKTKNQSKIEPSSFRDPSGFVHYHQNQVYRQINPIFFDDWHFFIDSGLSQRLVEKKFLAPFIQVESGSAQKKQSIQLRTEKIPFISYPYEWAFSQLKDAALLTLEVQKIALEHDMSLKDASAFNVQFLNGKAIFIDLLSFERYQSGMPWVAYQQFCEHFLCPLLLMVHTDTRLSQLLKTHLNGIPLDLTSKLLPKSTYLNPSVLSHVHLHAHNQKKYAQSTVNIVAQNHQKKLSKILLLGIIDNLEHTIRSLHYGKVQTEWGEYYTFTNYSEAAFSTKKKLISKFISQLNPSSVWDLGGNTGEFSRLVSDMNIPTISFDIDPAAVEKNYLEVKEKNETHLLPLQMDFMNQSPNLGWLLQERKSLIDRGPADVVMALALVHHLGISNNVPFEFMARYFQQIGKSLIVEFVPKSDSKVKILLSSRKDVFPTYDASNFEKVFRQFFKIKEKVALGHGSARILYLMTSLNEKK